MSAGALRRGDYAVIGACVLLFAAMSLPLAGSMIDDTYIHLQYARNLAGDGQLAFNRGDPSYGATSPLWVGILAVLLRAGLDATLWCRILSWLSGAAVIALLYRFVLRLGGRRGPAAAAAAIAACEAWLLRWSATGMETSLAALVVLLCLCASLDADSGRRGAVRFGLLLMLAALARPEAMLLAPLAAVSFALAGAPSPWRRRFAWAAVFLPLLVAWLFLIERHTGTLLPLTAGAKQGRVLFGAPMLRAALVPLKIVGATALLPAAAALAFLAAGTLRGRRLTAVSGRCFPGGVLLSVLWTVAVPAVYVVFDFHVLSRYLVPVIPAIVAVGTVAAARLIELAAQRRMRLLLAVFAAAACLQSAVFYAAVVVGPTREFTRGLDRVLVPMGRFLAERTPEEAVVATPDIGAIGWFSRRAVLDLGGLVTPRINEMRRLIDVQRIIDDGLYLDMHPTHLVDRHAERERLAGRPIRGVRFAPLMSGTVQTLGIRQHSPVTYTLYRLVYPDTLEPPLEGAGSIR
ncbi:MAG: hypothetical protein PHQ19_01575 [Candidatus Krumholzibacteria bacterium]|nr:hypothetical protein [Candidatus Krumholzibacteria bacterium]